MRRLSRRIPQDTVCILELRRTAAFDAWLADLADDVAAARIARRLERLASGHLGDAKPLGGGIGELRIDHGPGYRIYYTMHGRTLVILLIGGQKGSQARDIARARALAMRLEE